jgi:hypothetical protein
MNNRASEGGMAAEGSGGWGYRGGLLSDAFYVGLVEALETQY